jgi:citrate lyase subunit beta / citryl-CoA lyase
MIKIMSDLCFFITGILELWCMIETAKGVQNVDLIANLESVQTLVFGSNDLTKDLKARHTPTRY